MEKIQCELCGKSIAKAHFARDNKRKHPVFKSDIDEETVPAKKRKLDMITCPVCKDEVSMKNFQRHMKNKHSCEPVRSAFSRTCTDYELVNSGGGDTHSFLIKVENECVWSF